MLRRKPPATGRSPTTAKPPAQFPSVAKPATHSDSSKPAKGRIYRKRSKPRPRPELARVSANGGSFFELAVHEQFHGAPYRSRKKAVLLLAMTGMMTEFERTPPMRDQFVP